MRREKNIQCVQCHPLVHALRSTNKCPVTNTALGKFIGTIDSLVRAKCMHYPSVVNMVWRTNVVATKIIPKKGQYNRALMPLLFSDFLLTYGADFRCAKSPMLVELKPVKEFGSCDRPPPNPGYFASCMRRHSGVADVEQGPPWRAPILFHYYI